MGPIGVSLLRVFRAGGTGRRRRVRRVTVGSRRALSFALAPVVVVALAVVPVAIQVVHAPKAKASSGSVLILTTSVNDGSSSAEAEAVPSGYTVTIESASAWDDLTEADFEEYSAIIIGDPSTDDSCSTTVPAAALSDASTWGAAVTSTDGHVAVLGTASALAGSSGTTLMKDAIGYTLSGSGTGLYVSLNCEYSSASAGTSIPLLADVYGGGFEATGQSSACQNSGTVNTVLGESVPEFNGLTSSDLASWASPACSVEETVNEWPANFSGLAYDSGVSPAVFTASDGATGQPYVLLGSEDSSTDLAPSTGGDVESGATTGGSNASDPGLTSSETSVADPVNPETGELAESSTDLSVSTYGPSLGFTRTYDSVLAEQETETGAPGALGYGWTDNYASSVNSGTTIPGDIYTIDGRQTDDDNGGLPTGQVLDTPGQVMQYDGDTYIADTTDNRIEEIAGADETEWGITMTAGHMYTVAGNQYGDEGESSSGTAADDSELNLPEGVVVNSTGMYIADTDNCRVVEIAASTGTQWGISMTADDLYTIAGENTDDCGTGSDGEAATSSELDDPVGLAFGADSSAGSLFIADSTNNRIQELAYATGTQWGQSMTKDDIYTVMGLAAGTEGTGHTGHPATSTDLDTPMGVSVDTSGNLYVADTYNCRALMEPVDSGSAWGYTVTADYTYPLAGQGDDADCGTGTDGDTDVSQGSLLNDPWALLAMNGNLYIADSFNGRIQEVAGTTHTERGISMTADDVYTVAGSSAGDEGSSGDGGAATSALLADPEGIWADSSDDLYISDTTNNVVRKVSYSTYDISAFAGTGGIMTTEGDGGSAVTAGLQDATGTAVDSHGDVYVVNEYNNEVQEIAAYTHTQYGIAMTAGDIYTVAGSPIGELGDSGDGDAATSALLAYPQGIAVDSSDNLYIADSNNSQVREVSASTGDISTIAGNSSGTAGYSGDGGVATSALLDFPSEVQVDASGNIYILDAENNRVQEIARVSGTQHGVTMTKGDIYTIAGSASGTAGYSGIGGAATSAELEGLNALAVDSSGNIYFGADDEADENDYGKGGGVVLEIPAASGTQRGISMTANDIYAVAGDVSAGSATSGVLATSERLDEPSGLAVDAAGDIYISDGDSAVVWEVAAENGTQWSTALQANHVYIVAGALDDDSESGDGGKATSAELSFPDSLSTDSLGDVYISDDDLLREIVASSASPFAVSPSTGGQVVVTQDDGSQVPFVPESSGACTSPYTVHGDYCALPQYTSSLDYSSTTDDYTFSMTGGTTDTYSSAGDLLSESDAAGNTLTLTYGSPAVGSGDCPSTASTCDTVTAADGRELVIAMTDGLVTSVTDPMGRTWTYGYNSSDDLTSVTDPLSRETKYTYGEGSTASAMLANDLLTITKPAGGVTTNTYDDYGRVLTQTGPMGYETTFDYADLDTATGDGVVWVGDPDGYSTAYDYSQGALVAESKWDDSTLKSEDDYDPNLTSGTLLDSATWNGDGDGTSYAYNSAGGVTSTTDPDGGTTTSEFTSLNQDSCDGTAEAATACSSSETGPAVVAPGEAITVPTTAPPSGVTYTLYDTDGNELYTDTAVYAPGSSTASYQQVSYTLYKGNTVTLDSTTISCTYTPPSQSLPCAMVNPDGVVSQVEYDTYGDPILFSVLDATGSVNANTTYTYDADGEQTAKVSPDGNESGANAGNYTTTTVYNADGEKTSVTEGDGSGATVTARTTTYGYDSDGNQTAVEDARGYTTTTVYNADDQATLVTNPDGDSTLTCYDGDGNSVETVPAVGVAADSLTASSCPVSYPADYGDRLASDATTYTYDADGDKTAETVPAPAGQSGYETTSYTYDAARNLQETTAPPASDSSGASDDVTYDTYDADGNLVSETTGYGTSTAATTAYCYDPSGDKTAVVYGDGNTGGLADCQTSYPWTVNATDYPTEADYQTTYAYDSTGELVSTTTPATTAAPDGATTTTTYDDAGNELTTTDPDGITTIYTYTPAGKKATVTYSGSSAHEVTYSYDPDGNKTAMTDASGSSSYTYDPFGELTSTTNGNDATVSYTYDLDEDITGITYPIPSTATWATTDTVTYGYDHADQMTSATDFTGSKIAITDNADGNTTSETLGSSGDTITTSYDSTGAAESITLANSSGTTLQSFTYADAPDGDTLTETDSPTTAGTSKTYTYDSQSQVASEATSSATTDYSFDESGNLTELPEGATGTYDDDGELTSSTSSSGTVTDYTYNADGERTAETRGGTTTASATWNGAGELTSYDDSSGDMTSATYDGDGLRATSVTSSGGTQDYTWNTLSEDPQLLTDSANAYIYATGTAPAEQVNLSTGTVTYLVTDSLGSVRGTVNASGTLTGTCAYDVWGNPETADGLTATTPYGYAGYYTDVTGLTYNINRYYDSSTGQFSSVDPLVIQTGQAYEYADGNPVSATDPDGLWIALQCFAGKYTRTCTWYMDASSTEHVIHLLSEAIETGVACSELGEVIPVVGDAISLLCYFGIVGLAAARAWIQYDLKRSTNEPAHIGVHIRVWYYRLWWWWFGWHHGPWLPDWAWVYPHSNNS